MAAIGIQFEFNIGDRVSIPTAAATVIGVVIGLHVNRGSAIQVEVERVTTTGSIESGWYPQSVVKAA